MERSTISNVTLIFMLIIHKAFLLCLIFGPVYISLHTCNYIWLWMWVFVLIFHDFPISTVKYSSKKVSEKSLKKAVKKAMSTIREEKKLDETS